MFGRITCIRQHDESDCGAAAIATVALHHRIKIGLQKVRDLCGTDRAGTNLLGLVEAAEALGFSAQAVKGEWPDLKGIPLPAIAHVTTPEGLGHFVVLHRLRRASVVVADPARGVETLSREEFCEKWTGYLLLLVPEQLVETPRGEGVSPWRRFLAMLRPHTPILAEAFGCAILLTILGLTTSYFIQHLVDSVLVHSEVQLLNALGLGMAGVMVFRLLFELLRQHLLIHVSRKVDLRLISEYARHVLSLPLSFFEMRRVGEILSRINDAVRVREAISGTTLSALVDGTLVVISASVMFLYDWKLATVACLFAPLLVISVMAHHPSTKRRSRQTMEDGAQLQAHLVEDVSAVETIKTFRIERTRADEGDAKLVKVVQSVFSLQKLGMSMGAVGAFVPGIAGIVVLWMGGHQVINGVLTIGQLMFFFTLLGYMLDPLENLASVNMQMQDALVAVDRLHQILDLETEKLRGDKQAVFEELREGIKIQGVSFRYGARANVLDGISLEIPAGKTVAIVGESGSGKSTLLKLLMRFYEPTKGRITFDGVDARDITLESLRRGIGLVSQDPHIFSGTIADNVCVGRPDADLNAIAAAIRGAGLEEFIAELPDRYDTMIGERGANLSGGQRQRLSIARVLLARPEILIFDEATSHLDTATERAIQESLRTELAGKTVILVAHRLSTIRDADVIYVMKDGTILEHGTHAGLVAAGGYYASLWAAQSDDGPAPTPPPGRSARAGYQEQPDEA